MTNKESVQTLYDLFGKGNVPAILDLVTDDYTGIHKHVSSDDTV